MDYSVVNTATATTTATSTATATDYGECTDKKLEDFSREHYTYINQIFGDMTIRQIISEIFPNKKYEFGIEDNTTYFGEPTLHHILIDKTKPEGENTVCSVIDTKFQNPNKNRNDTLCQSYSLLTYLEKDEGRDINTSHKDRQIYMINMYRFIMSNQKFLSELKNVIHDKDNKNLWKDYFSDKDGGINLNMENTVIVTKIRDTLKKWKAYGYLFFIGNGKCPPTKLEIEEKNREIERIKKEPPTPRITRSMGMMNIVGGGKKNKKTKQTKTRRSKSVKKTKRMYATRKSSRIRKQK